MFIDERSERIAADMRYIRDVANRERAIGLRYVRHQANALRVELGLPTIEQEARAKLTKAMYDFGVAAQRAAENIERKFNEKTADHRDA